MSAINLSGHEIQSGSTRVSWAEGLIVQLDEKHEGRNSWLMNYGVSAEANRIREADIQRNIDNNYVPREFTWDEFYKLFK